MKKVTNNILKGMASRFSATVMLLAMGCIAAFAQGTNKLYIEDFDIAPGETKTLDIILDNEDPVSSIQFDITFPSGLTYVEGSLAMVDERFGRSSHRPMAVKQNADEDVYRMGIISTSSSMSNSSVKGNEGVLLRLQVTAANDYKGSSIMISNIIGSNGTVSPSVKLNMEECSVDAGVHVGDLVNDRAEVCVRPLEMETVEFSLNNIVDIVGIEAVVTLPECVCITENADGKKIIGTGRLSGNVDLFVDPIPGENNKHKLVISSLTSDVFAGNEGTLFALNIMANKDFTSGDILVSGIIVSTTLGIAYELDNNLSVKVICVTDPSGDGEWTSADITAVANAVLLGIQESVYDVNNDGNVSSADITVAASKVLGN
ncbi:MAG: dockerin type I domain-containing protein [Prevotella sp.]|nr:dockerin type I domain-containing protein [Prevotella sp.]